VIIALHERLAILHGDLVRFGWRLRAALNWVPSAPGGRIEIGSNIRLRDADISGPGTVVIADRVRMLETEISTQTPGARIEVGELTLFGASQIESSASITIGGHGPIAGSTSPERPAGAPAARPRASR
jgi:hypothetical protein